MSDSPSGLVTLPGGRRAQAWLGGAATGPLVLLHHGCPDTRHVAMTGHDAAVAAGVRLLCVNRPGYGLSEPYDATHSSVADDAVAVARGLGHERFAVLGMSVGCCYALATAAIAAATREALHSPAGYLRDAALLLSAWEHAPEEVRCPVDLWSGALDDRSVGVSSPAWATRFADATSVVRPGTTHLATLLAHWPEVLASLTH